MHHLDNTEDFKESREEVMQSQRRRQSSFPPADGDEAAILLEKANIIRLEKVHQDALSIQGGAVGIHDISSAQPSASVAILLGSWMVNWS